MRTVWRPVAYWSRKLRDPETRYSATDLEWLGRRHRSNEGVGIGLLERQRPLRTFAPTTRPSNAN